MSKTLILAAALTLAFTGSEALAGACKDYGGRFSACVAPTAPPQGATAKCKDGSFSFLKNRGDPCLGHGGVATKLH